MSGPGRGIRNVTFERHFGNTPDTEIWTNIAKACGMDVKFLPLEKDENNQEKKVKK